MIEQEVDSWFRSKENFPFVNINTSIRKKARKNKFNKMAYHIPSKYDKMTKKQKERKTHLTITKQQQETKTKD